MKLVITSAPIASHWKAFQMEGEVDNAVHKKIGQYNFDRNVSVFLNSWFCLFIRNFSFVTLLLSH